MSDLSNLQLVCQALKVVYETVGLNEKDKIIAEQNEMIEELQKENVKYELAFENYTHGEYSIEDFCYVCSEITIREYDVSISCIECGNSFCSNTCGVFCIYFEFDWDNNGCMEALCNNCLKKEGTEINFYEWDRNCNEKPICNECHEKQKVE